MVIEPTSVGVVVSALIAKALNRAEDGVVDKGVEVARRAVDALRARFSRDEDAETVDALESLVEAPDSERLEKALAALLEDRASRSTDLRDALVKIIEEGESAGVVVGSIEQVAEGDGNVQIGGTSNSEVNVNRGPHQPRD